MIVDVETGRISDANPFLLELLGLSHSEMVGKTIGELHPFKNIEANLAMLELLTLARPSYLRKSNSGKCSAGKESAQKDPENLWF